MDIRGLNRWSLILLLTVLLFVWWSAPVEAKLTLQEAGELALQHSDRLHVSRENVIQAKARQSMVSSGLWPQISLYSRALRQKETEMKEETDYFYGAELNQYLFQGGKRLFATSAARGQLEASRAEDYRRRQEVLFNVAASYYEVLLERRNTEIARSVLQRAESQLERTRGRYEVGEITRTGVLRAEVQLARAREQFERAKNSWAIARDQLALVMGVEELDRELKEIEERVRDEKAVEKYYELAYNNRRDLDAIMKTEEALEDRLKAEQANYAPQFGIHGSYDYQEEAETSPGEGEQETWQVMLQASYPLFTGWRESAQINEARSSYRQATSRREEMRKSVRIDVRSAFLEMQTGKRVIEASEDRVEAASQNYEEIVARFEEGLMTTLDVSDAHDALNEAEQSLAASFYRQQLNILRLELAAGIYQQDLLN